MRDAKRGFTRRDRVDAHEGANRDGVYDERSLGSRWANCWLTRWTCIEYIRKLTTRVTQALLAVFPQIPNTIKKNLDEMERESLRLMNESFQLLIRRTPHLAGCV